ncbi:MAG TPA: hypothetical protein VIV60_19665, partial [Polyangiaceae bacterium]
MKTVVRLVSVMIVGACAVDCGSDGQSGNVGGGGGGGRSNSGGATARRGEAGSGTGGASLRGNPAAGAGGVPATGGSTIGGAPATGGPLASTAGTAGSSSSTGGASATGGTPASTGGADATAGSISSPGGASAAGGTAANTGGTSAAGGTLAIIGGSSATAGALGGAAGASATGGTATNTAGAPASAGAGAAAGATSSSACTVDDMPCGGGICCGGACVANAQCCSASACASGSAADTGSYICQSHQCVNVAGTMNGLTWTLPCTGAHSSASCATQATYETSTTLGGTAGITYAVTIRARGIVEQKAYTGGCVTEDGWQVEGNPAGDTYNVYKLEVSSPHQVLYLNPGASSIEHLWAIDLRRTIAIDAGASVTLYAASLDNAEIFNRDLAGTGTLSVPGVNIAQPYDGQFVQLDVVSVTPLLVPSTIAANNDSG